MRTNRFENHSLDFHNDYNILLVRHSGILVTTDSECVSLLSLDHKTSLGVLLLPDNERAQLDVV